MIFLARPPFQAGDAGVLFPQISSSFSKGQPLPSLQVPEQMTRASLIPPLKKTPKWMRRPTGVSFAVSVVCLHVAVCEACKDLCAQHGAMFCRRYFFHLPVSQIRSHFTVQAENYYSSPPCPLHLLAVPVLYKRNGLL